VYGQRRWFLFPPGTSTYSNIPTKQWLKDTYPTLPKKGRPSECMQRGGDVIFVPAMWGHATYTVQASVGVAVEFERTDKFFFQTLARVGM
jgi:hypothetical protein